MTASLLGKRIWKHQAFYLFMLPCLIWFFLFSYVPMFGIQNAFRGRPLVASNALKTIETPACKRTDTETFLHQFSSS